jgi:hypothetical protein
MPRSAPIISAATTEEERDRGGDAEAREDRRQGGRNDDLSHDSAKGQVEALRHPDQRAGHGIDAAIGGDGGGEEDAERDRRDFRRLADAQP